MHIYALDSIKLPYVGFPFSFLLIYHPLSVSPPRPSRVISRAPGLKLVVETLITSLKPIGNIVLICCAFFIIFGILGVQVNTNTYGCLNYESGYLRSVQHFFFPSCIGPEVVKLLQRNYELTQ